MDFKKLLDEKFAGYPLSSMFDKEKNILRYENKETGQGVNLDLNSLKPHFEKNIVEVTEEIANHIVTNLFPSLQTFKLVDNLTKIFPVIRSSSFPKENLKGNQFVTKEHTAESTIYYALDLGKNFQLIDYLLLLEAELNLEKLHEIAVSNLLSLEFTFKKDSVAGNHFYFVNQKDGFDASRILLDPFLDNMESEFTGTMAVAIPHQDVLILCDIQNDHGYSILAEMNMKFFTSGNIPITPVSFLYENKELNPIFIMK